MVEGTGTGRRPVSGLGTLPIIVVWLRGEGVLGDGGPVARGLGAWAVGRRWTRGVGSGVVGRLRTWDVGRFGSGEAGRQFWFRLGGVVGLGLFGLWLVGLWSVGRLRGVLRGVRGLEAVVRLRSICRFWAIRRLRGVGWLGVVGRLWGRFLVE